MEPLSQNALSNLSAFLSDEMGLLFPKERWPELERGIQAAALRFGCRDSAQCVSWLMSAPLSPQQVETLAAHLTVGETYFFRDPSTLKAAENEILPELIRRRRGKEQRLRLWSAGCSTGEEAYSIAILLCRLLPDLAQWNLTVLATDINGASLRKAAEGVYGRWSFRGMPPEELSPWLKEEGEGRWRVAERVRRLVSFEYLNLADDCYPSLATNSNAMDLVFCRNVLMYFAPDKVRKVVEKLHRSLVEEGWLILGPAEHVPASYAPFQPVNLAGSICYRKRSTQPSPSREPQPVEPAPGQVAGPAASVAAPEPADHYRRAEGLFAAGRYGQAAQLLASLREHRSLPADGLPLLVRAHANQGRLSLALDVCEQALTADKLDPALHFLKAEILQEQGRLAEAQQSLQRSLYLDPKLVLAHFALGNLALWNGRPERARKHFDNALALLDGLPAESILPGSEGMTAGRLREIILPIASGGSRAEGGAP